MTTAGDRAPFDTGSDPHYFPCWTYDSELADGPAADSTHRDLQNAWFSCGLAERKPHIQAGADAGPAGVDEPLTTTERWLREVGAHFTTRIARSAPNTVHLYLGMIVPAAWLSAARRTALIPLPLSSFDTNPGTAAFYATQDRPHPHHQSVLLALEPGAHSYAILTSEHLTHGLFEVHHVREMTQEHFTDVIGETHAADIRANGIALPVALRIRQRSVPGPAPATHHSRY